MSRLDFTTYKAALLALLMASFLNSLFLFRLNQYSLYTDVVLFVLLENIGVREKEK